MPSAPKYRRILLKVSGEALLDIVKHRNGPVGDVLLTFLKEFTTFTDRATAPTPQ